MMKSKIISIVCALWLTLALPVSAFATTSSPYDPYGSIPYTNIRTDDGTTPDAYKEATYVNDWARLLTVSEQQELEAKAQAIADEYHVAPYIFTVDNYMLYGSTPRDAAKALFNKYDLGYGSGRDCFMLLLSMHDRDYWLLGYGSTANRAFTDYARENYVAPRFLDDFKHNDWYSGFQDFLEADKVVLAQAASGSPMEAKTDPGRTPFTPENIAIVVVAPLVISLIICLILKSMSKTVRKGTEASAYVTPGSHVIREQHDLYTHTTVSRTRRESSNSSGGGTTIDSGGFSGSGGKF